MGSLRNAPQDFEDVSAPIALEPTLEPPAPQDFEDLSAPVALEPTLQAPVEQASLTGDIGDTTQVPADAELFDPSKSYQGEWVKFADGSIGQAYTVEPDFTPEQYEAVFPGWMDAMKNAPQDFEDLSAPVALEPSLEPPLERTARSRFFESFM